MDALGIAVIVAVLVVATTIGLWHRRTDGMIRDEAADKKRRAAILAAAGVETVEFPDRKSSNAVASAAAKAASGAAAAAVHGNDTVRAANAAARSAAAGVPAAPDLPADSGIAVPVDSGVPAPAGPVDEAASAEPAGADPQLAEPGVPGVREPGDVAAERKSGVVPDSREEPGVVEAAARDASAAGESLDQGLLDRLGIGPAQATLLQFSSAFCAPCRAVRRISGEVAELLPGVQHVEVDAESHLAEVRELNIWRTPTLLILDAGGQVVKRATGVPSKPQLIAALGDVLPDA
ncbi:TlpA family protein disulfide reductase [Paractinoplanes durhamensis]|uniref:Thioredoxin domain-containing protein n=1 Tax=Paractinoplanes durhamensis TaxID=113563 RepID=A0ABQ3Z4L4_9ACTN|nr:thioredoxin family protein [Actinoplanes durhamensis]GIE04484.1 hypothetical protein Adu01nite_58340 [Actinoplanes durhamensis]